MKMNTPNLQPKRSQDISQQKVVYISCVKLMMTGDTYTILQHCSHTLTFTYFHTKL